MTRFLNRAEARRFYDSFGAKQDQQGFYEDAPVHLMTELGRFAEAESVFELGCGTGRLAAQLLADQLPPSAHYTGVDISPTMIGLSRERLLRFGDRADVRLTDGELDIDRQGGPYDRIICAYVLDLLSPSDISRFLLGARASMTRGGLLCHVGLTGGTTVVSKLTERIWKTLHRMNPKWVGGCRPLRLCDLLADEVWEVVDRRVVVSSGIASEVVIAARR